MITNINKVITLTDLITFMHKSRYVIYEQPFELNIYGIRSINKTVNVFNDRIGVFYKDLHGDWKHEYWSATTKPGLYWLRNILNPKGTAILKPGQYIDTYAIDKHNGKYLALCQRHKEVEVYRDKNRNEIYDYDPLTIEKGFFGINLHRASLWRVLTNIDKNSAGCQVIPGISNFERLMNLAEMHQKLYKNVFTYTLIKESDLKIKVSQSLAGLITNKFRRINYAYA